MHDTRLSDVESRDADLVTRLRAGDAAAFADVVARLSPVMLHVARGFVSTTASAEDVVQEAWLVIIKGLGAFERRASLRTWACGITANIARRRRVVDAKTVPWTDAFGAGHDDGPTIDPARFRGPTDPWTGGWTLARAPSACGPERAVLDAEIQTTLANALAHLPPRPRTVVALRDIDGLTAEEVCDALGLTSGHQRVLLHRGRAQLRQLLEDYYDREAAAQ